MEVVAAVAACTIVPMVYNSVRKRMHVKVNCWFCQHDQIVPYEQRNSFMCSSCEQYNGFNESGGYNRKVPGQHCFGAVTPARSFFVICFVRYCKPAKSALARPDVVPQEGYGSNGLCDNCNRQQEIIMRKIADFEPLNELFSFTSSIKDRWSEELEMYRYKLNKAYPLCARCTFFTQNRLQEEKVVRRRRQFFAGGFTVELLHAISFVVAVLLFVSQFNYLQVDAELDLIWFPPFLQRTLPLVLSVAYHLVGVLFCAHMIAIWSNKCRTTLPDLMLPVVAGLHLASFSFPDNMYRQDLALFRCAFACFETLLATAVTFVPRKKIPRNRPNRMIVVYLRGCSAFSIASTPVSQCSSQATSCNNSMVLEKSIGGENRDKQQSSTPSLAIRQRNKWREREQTPEPTPASTRNRMGGDYEVISRCFADLCRLLLTPHSLFKISWVSLCACVDYGLT
ncbi:unnamed protein product [Heligmosomoides polygyrus]|uniref:Ima1_N domain-containing protein n=1 Tax=Heligmosomoides polygyrus TaxID=6339 RepID=A0A183F4G2_HELPZ|nr:unnamed protein product [Heligmosomoides polygyrus]